MDPLADKVLVAVALIMLIPMELVPAWLSFLIIARELVITGLRSLAASGGIVVAASRLGKLKSISQYTALCILIFPNGLLPITFLHNLGLLILYLALVLTWWSGIVYFYRLRAVFLRPEGV
jgi:CDP-diacylglycerol---glycerol-3-phosphate 3-phosphatidyltransferase